MVFERCKIHSVWRTVESHQLLTLMHARHSRHENTQRKGGRMTPRPHRTSRLRKWGHRLQNARRWRCLVAKSLQILCCTSLHKHVVYFAPFHHWGKAVPSRARSWQLPSSMALEKQNQGNLNLATYSDPGTHQQTPHVSSSSILAAADTYEKTLTEPRAQKQST